MSNRARATDFRRFLAILAQRNCVASIKWGVEHLRIASFIQSVNLLEHTAAAAAALEQLLLPSSQTFSANICGFSISIGS